MFKSSALSFRASTDHATPDTSHQPDVLNAAAPKSDTQTHYSVHHLPTAPKFIQPNPIYLPYQARLSQMLEDGRVWHLPLQVRRTHQKHDPDARGKYCPLPQMYKGFQYPTLIPSDPPTFHCGIKLV